MQNNKTFRELYQVMFLVSSKGTLTYLSQILAPDDLLVSGFEVPDSIRLGQAHTGWLLLGVVVPVKGCHNLYLRTQQNV